MASPTRSSARTSPARGRSCRSATDLHGRRAISSRSPGSAYVTAVALHDGTILTASAWDSTCVALDAGSTALLREASNDPFVAIVAADLDGDRRGDLVALRMHGSMVAFRGTSGGYVRDAGVPAPASMSGCDAYDAHAADLDHDGASEVVVSFAGEIARPLASSARAAAVRGLASKLRAMKPADRLADIELSLIRQINALATPYSVNLGIGEPNVAPDARLREMAQRAAAAPWQYSANAGHLSLRRKLCEGTAYDPKSEVCVTAGTQEGLFAVFTAYVNPGDEVLVPDPGFLSYATLAKMCGARAVPYKLEPPDWTIDVDALAKLITPRTKIIIVNTPSNPLGSVAAREVLERIAAHGSLVVSDEVYREIWYDAPPTSMTGMGDNVIVTNGLSKSHAMTGLRLGWIFAKESLMKPILTAHQYIATCASVFSQALAEMIFDDAAWNASWLESVRAQFREQRDVAIYAIQHGSGSRSRAARGRVLRVHPRALVRHDHVREDTRDRRRGARDPGCRVRHAGQGFVRIYAAPLEQITAGIGESGGTCSLGCGGSACFRIARMRKRRRCLRTPHSLRFSMVANTKHADSVAAAGSLALSQRSEDQGHELENSASRFTTRKRRSSGRTTRTRISTRRRR
jgi:aspartate aminotransferase